MSVAFGRRRDTVKLPGTPVRPLVPLLGKLGVSTPVKVGGMVTIQAEKDNGQPSPKGHAQPKDAVHRLDVGGFEWEMLQYMYPDDPCHVEGLRYRQATLRLRRAGHAGRRSVGGFLQWKESPTEVWVVVCGSKSLARLSCKSLQTGSLEVNLRKDH